MGSLWPHTSLRACFPHPLLLDSSLVLTLEPQLKKKEKEKQVNVINRYRHKLDEKFGLRGSFWLVCVDVSGKTARQRRTERGSQWSSLRTEPKTLSCDHQMLSLETLSTLPQTNKQAEFHPLFAAIKTPEAIFSKHPLAREVTTK